MPNAIKKILLVFVLLTMSFSAFAQRGGYAGVKPEAGSNNKKATTVSDTAVWVGLDYSLVRMIGGSRFEYGFNVPELIFPGMFEKWNQLFLDERTELVAHALKRRLLIDIGGVAERNKTATKDQILLNPGKKDTIKETHITKEDIAAEVKSYKMENTSGTGLVFIVDRFICPHYVPGITVDHHWEDSIRTDSTRPVSGKSYGAVYVVHFDIATSEVISVKREVNRIKRGGNFRNYWFGPIKDADKSLKKL